jgi:hypothetical protein
MLKKLLERWNSRREPKRNYLAGKDVFYKCTRCGEILPSLAPGSVLCHCYNIEICAEAGGMQVVWPEDCKILRGQQELPLR